MQQFTAVVNNQFGNAISGDTVTWTLTGSGKVGSTGLFTAGTSAGSSTVKAEFTSIVLGTASVTVDL